MKIFSNTAITLDGKITSFAHDHIRLGSEHDLIEMDRIRGFADAILIGGNTFRNLPIPLFSKTGEGLKIPILNVIVTRSTQLVFSEKYLSETRIKTLVLGRNLTLPNHVAIESQSFESEFNMCAVVGILKSRGVKNLLIEGGGNLIFQFLKENLLDEMYVTLCPKILGGASSISLVEGEGFHSNAMPKLNLLSQHVVHNEMYLHYKVNKNME